MANYAFCHLCEILNQPRTHLQWYHDIDAWYDGGNHCHKPNRFKVCLFCFLLLFLHIVFNAFLKVPIKQFDFANYTIPASAVVKVPIWRCLVRFIVQRQPYAKNVKSKGDSNVKRAFQKSVSIVFQYYVPWLRAMRQVKAFVYCVAIKVGG